LNLDWLDACRQAIETRAAILEAARSRLAERRTEIQQAGEVLQGWEVEDYSVLKPSGKTYWYKRRCRDRGQNDTEKCHVHISRKAEADTLAAIARGKQMDELDRQSKQLDRAFVQFQHQAQQLQTQVESLITVLTNGEEQ
jgi:prefoldin subunit 5